MCPTDSTLNVSDFRDAKLRRCDGYRLVTKENLSDAQREQIGSLADQPDFCALVLPEDSAASMKAVDYDAAALLSLLRRPRALPDQFSDAESRRNVLRLILDGIIEIDVGDDFVSGKDAYEVLPLPTFPSSERLKDTARLSRRAIRFGLRLNLQSPAALAARLYTFNRRPLTPGFSRRVSSAQAVRDFLRLDIPGPAVRGKWKEETGDTAVDASGSQESDRYWLIFRPRDPVYLVNRSASSGHKIYVSPQPDRVPDVFDTVTETISPEHVYRFKIARHPWGLLRPDKFVLYLRDESSFRYTAEMLTDSISDHSGQGVPFAGRLGDGELLSWGQDPSVEAFNVEWRDPGSWRVGITNILAQAIVDAQRWDLASPETYALVRVQLEGVDPRTWTPD